MKINVAFNRDCMDAMKEFPDGFFDLAVVDPPYGDGCSQSLNVERERERAGTDSDSYSTDTSCQPERMARKESVPPRGGDTSPLEDARDRVHRTGGTWAEKFGKKSLRGTSPRNRNTLTSCFASHVTRLFGGGNYFGLPPTRCFLVWRKTNVPLEGFSMAAAEYAWTSFNQNAMVFEFSAINQPGRFHPTQKPPELYNWIFKHFAKDGYKILDTHLGSGSSRIAAYDANLDFWGYEIDETYFQLQEERFARHTAQTSLFIDGLETI